MKNRLLLLPFNFQFFYKYDTSNDMHNDRPSLSQPRRPYKVDTVHVCKSFCMDQTKYVVKLEIRKLSIKHFYSEKANMRDTCAQLSFK